MRVVFEGKKQTADEHPSLKVVVLIFGGGGRISAAAKTNVATVSEPGLSGAERAQREIRVVRHDVCIRVFIIVVFVVALSPPVLHFEWNSWVFTESERTNVETHRRSPKKGSPKEHLSVDDDDEGDALPTEVASPKQPQSKAMKTSFSAPPSAVTFIFHAIAVSCFHYFPAVSANALRPPPT